MKETSVEELMGQFKSIKECAEYYEYEGLIDENVDHKPYFTFASGSSVEVSNQKIEDDTWDWDGWKIKMFTDDELDDVDWALKSVGYNDDEESQFNQDDFQEHYG
jgi:hypothetical protein